MDILKGFKQGIGCVTGVALVSIFTVASCTEATYETITDKPRPESWDATKTKWWSEFKEASGQNVTRVTFGVIDFAEDAGKAAVEEFENRTNDNIQP